MRVVKALILAILVALFIANITSSCKKVDSGPSEYENARFHIIEKTYARETKVTVWKDRQTGKYYLIAGDGGLVEIEAPPRSSIRN